MMTGLRDTAIEAIYAAANAPEAWPQALAAMAACFDAVGTVLLIRRPDSSAATIVSPGLELAAAEYEAGAWQLDFMVPRSIEISVTSDRACYTDQHLATATEIATHPFYTDFRARHGLGPFMGAFVSPKDDTPVIVTLQGRLGRGPFTEAELDSYFALTRHVERSLALSMRLLEAESTLEALGETLERLQCGIMLLDAARRPLFANTAMGAVIGRDLKLVDGRLVADGPWRDTFYATCKAATGEVVGEQALPSRAIMLADGNGGRVAVYVHPVPGPRLRPSDKIAIREVFLDARLLIMALQSGPNQFADPAILRDLLGLTLGEARVASRVAAGRTPRESARELGVSEETTRTVLKRVFAKVGVSRQSELAALIARIVPGSNS